MGKRQLKNADIQSVQSNVHAHEVLVLKSKTYKPTIRKEFIKRQALIDRLESNIALPLTMISAATGCGKSVTTSLWLEETRHKYGWISLDEEHNDPHVFLTYLETILKEQWPKKSFGLESLLQGVNLPSNLIATTFINDIDQLEDFFVLVLDDYHIIREEKIHEIINIILRYPPEQFQLVVLTQRDPPLHLARLRAQFQVNEIRMRDLAFTIDEAIKLRSLVASETTDEQVQTIVNQAEGWITGITVGLMGLAEGISIEKVIQALHSGVSVISELLDEIVISGLPVEVQKFLELTTLMDRFSKELVSSVVASIDDSDLSEQATRKLMKEAKEKNLFLIPLDPAGEWYRYHHLFRSQIRQYSVKYFNEQVVEVLHKATSSWFEEKGLLEEALNYATRSKDMTFALGLFSRFRHNLLNREQLQRLDRLTHQFPEDIRNNNPEILLILAILQHYNANFNGMQQYLSRAEELLYGQSDRDDHEKQLIGEFHAVSTYFSYMRGDFEKAIHHGEKSMEFLPACKPNFFREHSTGWYAFAQQACGQASAGMDRLESEYRALANADQYFQMRLLQGKLIFNLFEGNTAHLYQDGSSLANLCSPKTYPGSWVIGIYSMAYHSYVNNKPEKVSGLHDELRKYRFACRPFWVIQYFFIECLSYMAEEVWPNVEQCIAECEELAQKLAMEPFQGMVKAFQVEYYLKRHDVDRAREVSALANFEPQPPNFFYYIPQLTQVKLLFQTQQEEKGQVMLQDLLEMGRSRHNKNLLIQALTLQAVIHFRHKRKEQAKSVLHEALKIAESKGVLRPFLDHGQIMHHLLKDIAEDQPNNIQVIELLHAFDADQNSATFNDPAPGRNQEQELNALSKREIEILTLVTQGFKNKEIAKKLFISLDTVKKHLYRAYQKLDVKNRLSAIKRANELGLLFNSLVQKPKEE